MPLFGGASVEKLKASRDINGLVALILRGKKRVEASQALKELGDPSAVTQLIDELDNPTRHVRQRAALALGVLGDRRAVEPLIARLQTERSSLVQGTILGVLGLIGGPEAAAAERDWENRAASARTIQAVLVLSNGTPRIQALMQEIVAQQRGRGHSFAAGFRAAYRVTSNTRDPAFAYAAVRSEFPDLTPDGLADRTERFDFKSADGTATGHYYIVFDRPAAG